MIHSAVLGMIHFGIGNMPSMMGEMQLNMVCSLHHMVTRLHHVLLTRVCPVRNAGAATPQRVPHHPHPAVRRGLPLVHPRWVLRYAPWRGVSRPREPARRPRGAREGAHWGGGFR